MFDKVELAVRAGNGGDGAVSFRREKFVPFGGPDGGDGGDGGGVVIMADPRLDSLRLFRGKKLYRASNGESGKGGKKHGKKGEDLVLGVPLGTIALDGNRKEGDGLIADLEKSGQQTVVARGGRGGWGNTHFVSSTNQAPRLAQKGEAGEERIVILELRLIADVGIIGYPNVGKSTLLAAASAARPKVAAYPFTTLEPVLGVVEVGQEGFVLAEIPGLIEDAHLGRGLGHDFLRHAMRTKMLIHLIDGSSEAPVDNMERVNKELGFFDSTLTEKPQLVAMNKIDLPEVEARLGEIKEAFASAGTPVIFVSAASGQGVAELMAAAMRMLRQVAAKVGTAGRQKVFRPQPRGAAAMVCKEGDTFVVLAPAVERIVARVDINNSEVRQQLQRQLARLGVSRALLRAGVRPGDKVRCGDFQWEW